MYYAILLQKGEKWQKRNPMLIKWAKVFKAETIRDLEQLAASEEVLMTMVTHIKQLSEDEKIRQQCEARADYESRLISQYNQGIQQGMRQARQEAAQVIASRFNISIEEAMQMLES